jgi:hypothetical protein
MFAKVCIPGFACVLLVSVFGPAADDKDAPEEVHEIRVSLRLNAIQTAKVLDQYEKLAQREIQLPDGIRAAARSGDTRLPELQQALAEVQADILTAKKKLIELESEKAKLVKRLKKINVADETPAPAETANRLLEKILDRLVSIEKRLEKIERKP